MNRFVTGLCGVTVAALASSAALAEGEKAEVSSKFKARVRADWSSKTVTDSKDVKTNTAGFLIKKADLSFSAKSGNSKVAIKIDPLAESYEADTASQGKAVTNLIDKAYVEHKLVSGLSVQVGKLDAVAGAVENNTYSSYDFYQGSYFDKNFIPGNPIGANVNYEFGNNTIQLQIANGAPLAEEAGSSRFKTKGNLSTGLAFYGDFGAVKPVVTVSKQVYAQTKATLTDDQGVVTSEKYGKNGTMLVGVGAQVVAGGATIDAEVDTATVSAYKVNNVDTKKQTGTSIIVGAKYAVGAITPFLKVTSESHKLGADKDEGDKAYSSQSVGAEYALGNGARAHLAINLYSEGEKVATKTETKKGQELLVGTALEL